jgi:hypothetical protein
MPCSPEAVPKSAGMPPVETACTAPRAGAFWPRTSTISIISLAASALPLAFAAVPYRHDV